MQNTHEKEAISGSKRVNRGYALNEDLIFKCKRIALEEKRKLYEVMNDALAEYIERHEEKIKRD